MGLLAIVMLAIGLSLDTFAVSLSLGFASERTSSREKLRFLIVIGLFHTVMTFVGWFLGENVLTIIGAYDHWIAFLLLAFVGGKMIKEGLCGGEGADEGKSLLTLRTTLLLGVALSIDALVTGFSLGLVKIAIIDGSQILNVTVAAIIVGIASLVISAIALKIGNKGGKRLGAKAVIFGGIILILIGLRIIIEHIA